jgi:hypothetical protein
MSGPMSEDCATLEPALVELALGTLAGEERTGVLGHVEGCARCSLRLAELSAAADDLLHLAPPAEPPVGFEARVFERLGLLAPSRRRARQRPRVLLGAVASAATVAALAFAGGLLVAGHSGTGSRKASGIETASLVSGSRSLGEVMVYPGNPTWVFMYVDLPTWDNTSAIGPLRCQVLEDQGPAVTIGKFWLAGGKGAWAASVDQPAGRLRSARVVDPAGHVLATAALP